MNTALTAFFRDLWPAQRGRGLLLLGALLTSQGAWAQAVPADAAAAAKPTKGVKG